MFHHLMYTTQEYCNLLIYNMADVGAANFAMALPEVSSEQIVGWIRFTQAPN
jgi:hypothetical protein